MSEERLNHYKEWIEDNEEIVVDSSIFEELVEEIERLHSIIKEVRELRKQLAFEYYENGLEVGTNVVIEDLDKILDKESK